MSEDLPITPPEEGNEDLEKPSRRIAELPDGTLVVVEGKSFIENKFEYYLVDYGNGIKDKVRAYNIEFRDDMDISAGEPKPAYSNEEVTELTLEKQQARKGIIDFLTPRIKAIQDRKDNPRPGDEFQLAKLEAIVKLAHEGEFTKREKYSGMNAKGEMQKGGNSVLKYFASALEFEEEGSPRFKQISDIINSLENAGVDVSVVQKTQAEKTPDTTPPITDPDNMQPDKDLGKNKVDDTNANKSKKTEEVWLDPRYIQELKDRFEQKYAFKLKEEQDRRERLRDDSPILPSFREGIKAQVIKNAIEGRKDRAEWLAGEENFGSKRLPGFPPIEKWEVERPSDEIIRKIMEKLDEPAEQLNELAQMEDKRLKEHTAIAEYKPGDKVKVMNFGKLEDGWTVKGYQRHFAGEGVLVTNGKIVQRISEKMLRELQEQLHPDDFKAKLEKLKPLFNKKIKVKIGDDVIEADFAGVSQIGEAYVDVDTGELRRNSKGEPLLDSKGNPFHLYDRFVVKDIDELLSWQSLKSNEEISAEQAAKIERINSEIPENERKFELGQEVKIIEGRTFDTGWTVDDFKRHGDSIEVVLIKGGSKYSVEHELLLNWQSAAEDYQPTIEIEQNDKPDDDSDKDDSGSANKQDSDQKENEQNPKYKAQEQNLKDMEEKLEDLKKAELAESMWEKRWKQWKSFWKNFDAGETSREKRKNKQKKKVAQFAGGAAVVGVWPISLWGGIIGVPAFMGNQKYHNALRRGHKRQIEKLERDIKEEKEELEHRRKNESASN
jgi:hypothetical protein